MERKSDFIWYELMTTDPDGAVKFYGDVVGWTTENSGMPGGRYDLCKVGQRGIAGIMQMPPHLGKSDVSPHWGGYVHVDDVDAMAEKVKAAGGTIHRGPDDIPHVGRFAVSADPQGGVFTLFKPMPMQGEAAPPIPYNSVGPASWHELMTTDLPAAWGFYPSLFGWTKSGSMDMGPMGSYEMFSTNDQPATGGMMNAPEQLPHAFWTYYFVVDEITAAKARVEAAGGTIDMGPREVPGGMWIVQGVDPQGARFALVANPKA